MRSKGDRTIIVPGHWQAFYDATNVPAAVQVDSELRVTGHTGEFDDGTISDDPSTQIRQAFRNVGATIEAAGFDWADVVELSTFHVGLQAQADPLLEIAAEFLPVPFPAWTAVGITELIVPGAVIEIRCVARR